ncbi:MAG: ATP-dependent RecD-like DNA helicase [Bacillota bacterium]|nr:ATP-dependent RecD-like DNA helicase [Bacillota bacterium]
MEVIKGTVERIIYRSETDGFTVLEMSAPEGRFTAVGIIPFLNEGERAALSGDWAVHAAYGRQFRVCSFEPSPPEGAAALKKYLASGAIKGIGPATADAIIGAFGQDALDIMQYAPHRLMEVYGIGEKKAETISRSFAEQEGMRKVMLGLSEYAITLNQALKIYRLYGEDALTVVSGNPYRLIDDIFGIGFKTADKIALSAGIGRDSAFRVRAGIKYTLSEALDEGHTHLPFDELVKNACGVLGLETATVEKETRNLALEREIVLCEAGGETCCYLAFVHTAETDAARRLFMLARNPCNEILHSAPDGAGGLELTDIQQSAVRAAAENSLVVITGGPGTGKTTIIKKIISMYESAGLSFELAAPTGRAAKRMSEAAGREARTIHRLLEYGGNGEGEEYFNRNEKNPLEADALIVDEMSMVDLFLLLRILRAIKSGTRLVLVGDADQLPSLGPGDVLRDIIESGAAPCVRLTEIFRQEGQSGIITNAHRINEGKPPQLSEEGDFVFLPRETGETAAVILSLCQASGERAQILTPMRRHELGVVPLNALLQETLNPGSPFKQETLAGGTLLREGDKVMQIRNNYKIEWVRETEFGGETGIGVFNGDIGTLALIDKEEQKAVVEMDDGRIVTYEFASMDELELAYAISVHKSQGSEFDTIIMPVYGGPPMLMTRNMLYTAVTRAKRQVYLVGRVGALHAMIRNNRTGERYTNLAFRLKLLIETIGG